MMRHYSALHLNFSCVTFLALQKVRSSPNLKYHLYRKKTLDQTSNESLSEEGTEEGDLDMGDLTIENHNETKEQQVEILHTVTCHVVAPGMTVAGILAVTSSNLYFSADDSDAALKKIDSGVRRLRFCHFISKRTWLY